MAFHLGKPILVMIICAAAAGVTSVVTRTDDRRADLELWCFSEQNWKTATGAGRPAGTESLQQIAERDLGKSVGIRLIQFRALNTRLSGMFMSDTRGPDLPDLVDIEIGSVGQYFRPPVDQVGFLPLNDLIQKHGWTDKIVGARLATWSKHGTIFGIPEDVHPVMLVYNDDLFRQAGVDLSTSHTWDQLIENGLRFQQYWRDKGVPRRWALEMSESSASVLVTMLLERGINLVDQNDEIHLTDEKTIDTLVTYCGMMTGPGRIGASTAAGNETFSQDLGSGYVSAMLCADWRLRYLRDNAPSDLAGKMRAMPMPMWPDSPYKTSTAGGSMVGIPRNAPDPEAAWKLLETLYLKSDATRVRQGATYVLPAVKAAWTNPEFDQPDPYFGGQPIKRMIADLAADVPPRYVSPASTVAELELSMVMIDAIDYAGSHTKAELREHCRRLLAEATERIKRQIEHGSFEE